MTDFRHITDWKLQSGSHEFPGPDGGTCINEAAIVAAGFEYKKVKSVDDFPPCFSKVLGGVAMILNDRLDDKARNALLMPLVMRLSGSADDPMVEAYRADMILGGAVAVFSAFVGSTRAARWDVQSPYALWDHQDGLMKGMITDHLRPIHGGLHGEIAYLAEKATHFPPESRAANFIWEAIRVVHKSGMPPTRALAGCAGVLTAAFDVGNKAPPLEHAKVVERMDAARKAVRETVTVV